MAEKRGGGWKKAAQHMHLRKTKLRKGCFCLLKPKSTLVSRMMFHAPELGPAPQREEGMATAVPVVFMNMPGVKFLSSGFLRGKSWHTPSARCKFSWYWLELAWLMNGTPSCLSGFPTPGGNYLRADQGLWDGRSGLGIDIARCPGETREGVG